MGERETVIARVQGRLDAGKDLREKIGILETYLRQTDEPNDPKLINDSELMLHLGHCYAVEALNLEGSEREERLQQALEMFDKTVAKDSLAVADDLAIAEEYREAVKLLYANAAEVDKGAGVDKDAEVDKGAADSEQIDRSPEQSVSVSSEYHDQVKCQIRQIQLHRYLDSRAPPSSLRRQWDLYAAIQEKKLGRAVILAEQCLSEDPFNEDLAAVLAGIHLTMYDKGNNDKPKMVKGLTSRPEWYRAAMIVGAHLFQRRNFEPSYLLLREVYGQLILKSFTTSAAHLKRIKSDSILVRNALIGFCKMTARTALKNNNLKRTLAAYEHAKAFNPRDAELAIFFGRRSIGEGKLDDASRFYGAVTDEDRKRYFSPLDWNTDYFLSQFTPEAHVHGARNDKSSISLSPMTPAQCSEEQHANITKGAMGDLILNLVKAREGHIRLASRRKRVNHFGYDPLALETKRAGGDEPLLRIIQAEIKRMEKER